MKKIKDYALHLNSLRKQFGFAILSSAMKSQLKTKPIDDLSGKKILILAPHPDDETIGCGGLIAKAKKSGSDVRVVFFTDGSAGVSDKKLTNAQRAKLREREAKSACIVLGLKESDLVFWRYQDGKLTTNSASVKLLNNLLTAYLPDIVLTPFISDPHPDHAETSAILRKSLEVLNIDPEIMQYEVWTPILANRTLSIDESIKLKMSSLGNYKSQISSRDYLDGVEGLNRYRGAMTGQSRYVEAFFTCNKKIFLDLYSAINQ